MRTKILLIIVSFVLSSVLFISTPSFAQEEPNSTIKSVETSQISGKVTSINDRSLVIQTNDGVKEISVSENVNVTQAGMSSKISDLSPNDQVTLTVSKNGQVLVIESIPGEIIDWMKLIIPALLIGLILAIWLFSAVRNREKGNIKTSIEKEAI